MFSSPSETADFAVRLGAALDPGDCILLSGPIGAGKSHFARHLIQSRMTEPEDVPSPTFTLVQVYDLPECELWHADLYRLSSLDEIDELGLTEAWDSAISLIEWPDRLAETAPTSALSIDLSLDPVLEDARHAALTWTDPKWVKKLEFAHDV